MTDWWNQPIARDLGLSDDQNKQIRATVAESRDRLIQLRDAVDSAEAVLRDLMDEDKVDTRRAQAAIEQVVSTHAEMMRAVAQMSLKLRAILTSRNGRSWRNASLSRRHHFLDSRSRRRKGR